MQKEDECSNHFDQWTQWGENEVDHAEQGIQGADDKIGGGCFVVNGLFVIFGTFQSRI